MIVYSSSDDDAHGAGSFRLGRALRFPRAVSPVGLENLSWSEWLVLVRLLSRESVGAYSKRGVPERSSETPPTYNYLIEVLMMTVRETYDRLHQKHVDIDKFGQTYVRYVVTHFWY